MNGDFLKLYQELDKRIAISEAIQTQKWEEQAKLTTMNREVLSQDLVHIKTVLNSVASDLSERPCIKHDEQIQTLSRDFSKQDDRNFKLRLSLFGTTLVICCSVVLQILGFSKVYGELNEKTRQNEQVILELASQIKTLRVNQ